MNYNVILESALIVVNFEINSKIKNNSFLQKVQNKLSFQKDFPYEFEDEAACKSKKQELNFII